MNAFRSVAGRRAVVALSVMALVAAGCGSSGKSGSTAGSASKAAATKSTFTIGLVTPETGVASDTYTGVVRAAEARIDQQNAQGGLNGHKLKLLVEDDTSTPAGNATATQELLSKNVLGVIQISPFTFQSAPIMQKQGVPVVGSGTDGPEWGEQPNTNMFSLSAPSWDPKSPQYSVPLGIWKGVTSIGSFGYGQSPASLVAGKGFAFAAKQAGLKVSYLNLSIPFGSVNVGPIALAMKQKKVDGIYMPLDEGTNLAIITAARQTGVSLKVAISATGYGQSILDDPAAVRSGQGVYFLAAGKPVETNSPVTTAMQKAFATYVKYTGVPDFGWYQGWMSADLMIKGLQVAGSTPTRQSIITNLRKVTNYSAGGLLGTPENFTQFGTDPKVDCSYYTILKGSQFVPLNNGKPYCSTKLANSDQSA